MASRVVQELSLASLQPAERPRTVLFEEVVSARATARAVEFIAKPGKTDELRSFLCQAVAPLFGNGGRPRLAELMNRLRSWQSGKA